MIKLIIVGVACFVVALAGSTGVVVMTAPKPVAAADSAAVADSTLHAAGGHEGALAHDAGVLDQVAAPEGDSDPNPMQLAEAVPFTGEAVPHGGRMLDKPEEPADFGRVGKILVNMKPAEAAAILVHLSDAQVEGVLRSLGPRQAATMLASISAERAAQLSKRLLVTLPAEGDKR